MLTSIFEGPQLWTIYLIIHALDECPTGLDQLLQLFAQKSSAYPHVKCVVSSRKWSAIGETLDAPTQKCSCGLN
jgi:hypothetical protein